MNNPWNMGNMSLKVLEKSLNFCSKTGTNPVLWFYVYCILLEYLCTENVITMKNRRVNTIQLRMLGNIHGAIFSKSRQIYLLECSSSSFLFIFHKVTGANKGIGFAIVKKLCKEFSGTVILTGNFGNLFTVYCDSIFSF